MDNTAVDIFRTYQTPIAFLKTELDGIYGQNVIQDMADTIKMYQVYEHGADFPRDELDFKPADLKSMEAANLINKVARFMFSRPAEFFVDVAPGDTPESRKDAKGSATIYQTLVDNVLSKNTFQANLVKAAKDCFIGKRVALVFNINETDGIQINFLPSLEFVYDVNPSNINEITKFIAFYGLNDVDTKKDQRIYKKKYWLQDGYCWYSEEVYNGRGELVETIKSDTMTKFSFIPAWVIVNDGLTGDLLGVSEMAHLKDFESWFSRLSSADIDAERKGMNPVRYTVDASAESTQGLKTSPGAFWDLVSDPNSPTDRTAQVGTLENNMSYAPALSVTLDRIKSMMHDRTAVPDVSPAALKGVVSSGKTLKAIYWDLVVRCDEKMLVWRSALQGMAECIIEGTRLYPKVASMYITDALPDTKYTIRVDNQYSLPEDEQEEKTIDLSEVTAQTMSKKAYMKKWRGLTDEEADEELKQIALERQLLEDNFSMPDTLGVPPKENTTDGGRARQAALEEEEVIEEEEEG